MAERVEKGKRSTRDEEIAAIRTWLNIPMERFLSIALRVDDYVEAAQTMLRTIECELEERRGKR